MEKRKRPGAQNMGRMISHGMNIEDYMRITSATEIDTNTWEKTNSDKAADFVDYSDALGDEIYKIAEEQEKLGNIETASSYYMRASACYRLADYGLNELTEEKKRIYAKVPLSFKKGKSLSKERIR